MKISVGRLIGSCCGRSRRGVEQHSRIRPRRDCRRASIPDVSAVHRGSGLYHRAGQARHLDAARVMVDPTNNCVPSFDRPFAIRREVKDRGRRPYRRLEILAEPYLKWGEPWKLARKPA
jgi:hypothetical protein